MAGAPLDQGARVGFWLSVERDEGECHSDWGEVEDHAPADGGPEAVEGVDDLTAYGVDSGVEAGTDGSALADGRLGLGHNPLHIVVDQPNRLVDVSIGQVGDQRGPCGETNHPIKHFSTLILNEEWLDGWLGLQTSETVYLLMCKNYSISS